MVTKTHFILYVKDQGRSTAFYKQILGYEPVLDVPGMTEFELASGEILGLMPVTGIQRLLGDALPDPSPARGIARCELYFIVDDPMVYHARALAAGAKELSPFQQRDWGHSVSYVSDEDGHVIAFASTLRETGK